MNSSYDNLNMIDEDLIFKCAPDIANLCKNKWALMNEEMALQLPI